MNEFKAKKEIWLKRHKRLLIGIGTLILILFMFFIVDFSNILAKIAIIGMFGTFLFVITYTIAFLLRAYKLKIVFSGLDQNISYTTSFFSIGASFAINDFAPGKLGDLAKIVLIKDQDNIKLSDSICGNSIERILDLLLLFSISCFALIYVYYSNIRSGETRLILGQNIQFYLIIGVIFLTGILVGLILLIYKTNFIINVIGKFSAKLADYFSKFISNFKEGMKEFKEHKKQLIFVILLGFPTWFVDAFIIVFFFYILGYQLDIFLLLLAILLSFFSKAIPITPGGWGISENVGALFIFIFYPEIPYLEILSIFIIDHLFRSAYLFFYGGYSVFHYNFRLKELDQLNA